MNIIFRNIVLFFITLVLANCVAKSATQMKSDAYKAGCEAEVKILKSYGDTIRI